MGEFGTLSECVVMADAADTNTSVADVANMESAQVDRAVSHGIYTQQKAFVTSGTSTVNTCPTCFLHTPRVSAQESTTQGAIHTEPR